ncbi:MAG: MFS transporter [Spirochaetes bacterium]|jgi:MFS family permease|nr:MFS transporter [Spirochaetota bacterium]
MTAAPLKPRMTPNCPGRLRIPRTVVLSLGFFSVLLAWSYFNLRVPLLLDDLLPDIAAKDTLKGMIMAIDNILALLLQPFFGDLSDRTSSRLGRRMPYIIVGTSSGALFFAAIPWIQALAGFIAIVFLFNLAMSFYRTVSLVIVADYTPDDVRARASAIQQFVANMGGVIGFSIPILLSRVPLSQQIHNAAGFALIAVLMLGALAVQVLTIRETPTGTAVFKASMRPFSLDSVTLRATRGEVKKRNASAGFDAIRDVLGKDRNMLYFVIAVFFWYLGFASTEAFFSSFAVSFLGKANEAEASQLLLAFTVPMILFAYPAGLVGTWLGRKRAVVFFLVWLVISLGVMAGGVAPVMFQATNDALVIAMLILTGMPWMGVVVNSFPLMWGFAPERRIATYTGVYFTFNQGAYSLAPIVMGSVLSAFSGLGDYRYIAMFPFVLGCFLIGLIVVLFIRYRG